MGLDYLMIIKPHHYVIMKYIFCTIKFAIMTFFSTFAHKYIHVIITSLN